MKRLATALLALTLLGACSERDMCLSRVNGELRTITRLTEETRANVTRGYAIGTRERLRVRERPCSYTKPDGTVIREICTDRETYTDRFPVAIDLNAEQAKLRSLEQRLVQEQRRVAAARAECVATYPE